MVWKLLRKNISVWQLCGYAAATLVGVAILMVALQFYRDVSAGAGSRGSDGIGLASSRNIVISKPVGLGDTFSGKAPVFSAGEIADLEAQPWCGGVSPFRAADFGVWAGIELGGRSMQTALFFESVPDSLIDIDSEAWHFDPSAPSVPIIIPKDYLALYNFGFAASGRMPPVSEAMLGSIPLTVTISGAGDRITLPGRIAGFSSWLNTVAVPEAFMDWAHSRFGSGRAAQPSRLIVELSDPADPSVERYLSRNGYERAGSPDDSGRATFLLRLITGVVAVIGLVITLLALGILMLSLYLLVQKNRRIIDGLLLLGYMPGAIAGCYRRLVLCINGAVLAGACIAMTAVRGLWTGRLEMIDIHPASLWPTILFAIGLTAVITALNFLTIGRLVRK